MNRVCCFRALLLVFFLTVPALAGAQTTRILSEAGIEEVLNYQEISLPVIRGYESCCQSGSWILLLCEASYRISGKDSLRNGLKAVCLIQDHGGYLKKWEIDDFPETGEDQTNLLFWADKQGEHLVMTNETGQYPSESEPEEGYRDAGLFAYHFLYREGSVKQTWKVQDAVKGCPVDITACFAESALQVTDLDKDNLMETWLLYKTGCRGDISPDSLRIVMYEGEKQHILRGVELLKFPDGNSNGGGHAFDDAFLQAPRPFRDFARKLWKKHSLVSYD